MLRALVFLALQGLILCLLLLARPERAPASTYVAATIDKHSRLQATSAPRIMFLGGSSVAFGTDASRVSDHFGRQGVNMGLYAGVSIEFMLREVEDHVQPGDWVVISLEYIRLSRPSVDSQGLKALLRARPESFVFCGLTEAGIVLDDGFELLKLVIGRSIVGSLSEPVASERVYRREAFNEVGDMVEHLDLPATFVPALPHDCSFAQESCSNTAEALNGFAATVAARGGQTFYAFPVFPDLYYAENQDALDGLAGRFTEELALPVIVSPADALLPSDWFYDTNYHPDRRGRERRTARLIAGLESATR